MTVGGARTLEEVERMALLGVDRMTIAVRSKEIEAVRDELGNFAETVIIPTRDV